MDFKYSIGERVIFDRTNLAEVIERDHVDDVNIYKIRLRDAADCWSVAINENRLESVLPGRLIKCECGADTIFGKYNTMHSSWCGKWVPHGTEY